MDHHHHRHNPNNTGRGRGRGSGGGRTPNYQHPPPPAAARGRGPQFGAGGVGRGSNPPPPLRPWGPSPSPPPPPPSPWGHPSPSAPAPTPPPPQPAAPVVDHHQLLPIHNLQISDHPKSPPHNDASSSSLQPIKRPDHGGTLAISTLKLLVNHFPVQFDPNSTILHYDVDVKPISDDPNVSQRKLRRSDLRFIRDQLFANYPQFLNLVSAYDDSKSIFSPVPLPEGQFTVDVSEGEDTKSGSYHFTIKFVNELKLSKLKSYIRGNLSYVPRDVLQAMDLVMKENLSQKAVRVGRSFYALSNGEKLPGGLAACWGFHQSLKTTSQGPVLCLDYNVMPFRQPLKVIDFLGQHIQGFRINDLRSWTKEVNQALKGLLVNVNHRRTKQKYTISGLTPENACDVEFDLVDPEGGPTRNVNLVTYFREKWNVDIKHKNLPCLELGKGNRSNKVPLEFCVLVPGQKYPKEHLDREADGILKSYCLAKPVSRKNTINAMVRAEEGPCGGGIATRFGIDVDTNMTKVVARVLDAPQLKLRGSVVDVQKDKCQWNLVGGRKYLVDGKTIEHWGVLEFVDNERQYRDEQIRDVVNNLVVRGNSLGMRMNNPISHVVSNMQDLSSVDKLESLFRKVIQKSGRSKLQLILCAMTRKDNGYKNLKWVAETRMGVVTQCYLSRSAANKRGQDQYLANLCLKINAKLGGNNFELQAKLLSHLPNNDRVMFIGADVNHPAAKNIHSPSIAAVVGSVNWPAANRYTARVLPQQHRSERIMKFGSMCMDLIENYKKFNGVRPNKIVIFRDGVSDAQFEMALGDELNDLKKVCADRDYNPMITLIVAQKRHQTRLFLDGNNPGNVPPGTVVDTDIVHPFEFDFYLCSHYGILGTSKPTHYYVLWDENSFTSDQLQKLIYDMCFIFARCTKPVSLVPPVYYADLVAYRGRMFEETLEYSPGAQSRASSSSANPLFDEELYKMHVDMENEMFFI